MKRNVGGEGTATYRHSQKVEHYYGGSCGSRCWWRRCPPRAAHVVRAVPPAMGRTIQCLMPRAARGRGRGRRLRGSHNLRSRALPALTHLSRCSPRCQQEKPGEKRRVGCSHSRDLRCGTWGGQPPQASPSQHTHTHTTPIGGGGSLTQICPPRLPTNLTRSSFSDEGHEQAPLPALLLLLRHTLRARSNLMAAPPSGRWVLAAQPQGLHRDDP